jgi:hypothetical protein
MLFLPSLLLFYLYDHTALGRKETIGYLILLAHLLLLEKQDRRCPPTSDDALLKVYYTRFATIVVAVPLTMHIFIHEASFLLFVPAHALITWSTVSRYSSLSRSQKVAYVLGLYLPVVIAFLVVVVFGRPSFEAAHAICSKWEAMGAVRKGACDAGSRGEMWTLVGAFTALPWSLTQAASLTRSLGREAILAWLFIFSVLGFLTVRFCAVTSKSIISSIKRTTEKTSTDQAWIMGFKYFFVPVAFSIPVYILAWDFGRWFAVACINYAIICLSKEVNFIELSLANASRGRIIAVLEKVNRRSWALMESTWARGYMASLVVLLSVIFYLRLPTCCIRSAFLAEPIRSLVLKLLNNASLLGG